MSLTQARKRATGAHRASAETVQVERRQEREYARLAEAKKLPLEAKKRREAKKQLAKEKK